ncbi:hypothetical protein IFR05_016310 [Cadophora sp. M221]|nr:hypothetical protein IFR05_016310 [Cadophora sp. M221]
MDSERLDSQPLQTFGLPLEPTPITTTSSSSSSPQTPNDEINGPPQAALAPYTVTIAETKFVWLGPLTTIYTPAPSCYQTTTSASIGGLQIYDYQIDTTMKCWPSVYGTTSIVSLFDVLGGPGNGYYSPGICPTGWTAASAEPYATNFYGTRSGNAVMCCPMSYALTIPVNEGPQCFSGLPGGGVVTNLFIPTQKTPGPVTMNTTETVTEITLTAISKVACSPISVSWEATDTPILRLLASRAGSTFLESASSSPSPSISSIPHTSTPTSAPSPSGLSTGAKAGVAIGVLAVVLAVGLGIFFFFRRRGKAARAREQAKQEKFLHQNRMRDVPPDTFEMLTNDNRHEMLTKHNISQLDVPGTVKRKPLGELEALPVVGVAELDGVKEVGGGEEGSSGNCG